MLTTLFIIFTIIIGFILSTLYIKKSIEKEATEIREHFETIYYMLCDLLKPDGWDDEK